MARLHPGKTLKVLYQAEEALFPYGSDVRYTLVVNFVAEKFLPLEDLLGVQVFGSPNADVQITSVFIEPVFFIEDLENMRISISFETENGNDLALEIAPTEAIQNPVGIMR